MAAKPIPFTPLELQQLFDYDFKTGYLTHRPRTPDQFADAINPDAVCRMWNTRFAGTRAGCINPAGYRQVAVHDWLYKEHRIIFLLICGWQPPEIDHINGIRDDNRLRNLRAADSKTNTRNKAQQKNNSSGQTGVFWDKSLQKWRAQIAVNRKKIHLGFFDDLEDAIADRKAAENTYGFHKNHGRSP